MAAHGFRCAVLQTAKASGPRVRSTRLVAYPLCDAKAEITCPGRELEHGLARLHSRLLDEPVVDPARDRQQPLAATLPT